MSDSSDSEFQCETCQDTGVILTGVFIGDDEDVLQAQITRCPDCNEDTQ